jgi:uncharacterized SAM-dependent methyltransferase
MSSIAHVRIHSSQFPERVRHDLYESLRKGAVNHKFHYDSVKGAQKWLELHQAYSPSRSDPDCRTVYERGFEAVCKRLKGESVHLIGLGCGGGQKDTRLLELLAQRCGELRYTPLDVSTALVLTARRTAQSVLVDHDCLPLVCDLASAADLLEVLATLCASAAVRIYTFFGMIPNFEPQLILHRLASLIRPSDILLFSANLSPDADYAAGVRRVLPLYDNTLTREWLMAFLLDCGVEADDGAVRFCVEDDPSGSALKRVAAHFHFSKTREIRIDQERFSFRPGDSIQLFFSYRHTPELIPSLLGQHGLNVLQQWITQSQEEGVFLVTR